MSSFKTKSLSWGRGLLVGWLGWTAYSTLYAGILTLQAGVVYVNSLFGSLLSHYLMALYNVPVWFLITRVLANKRWPLHLFSHLVGALLYAYVWHLSFLESFHHLFGEKVWQQAQLSLIKYWLVHEAIVVWAVFVGIFYVWRYQQQLRDREQREEELRLHANQMELAILKAQLNLQQFIRVHRRAIINISRIGHLEKGGEGGMIATMASGEEAKVSRRYAATLRELVV